MESAAPLAVGPQPKRPGGAEIDAVQRKIDRERLGQSPGAARQIQMPGDATGFLHGGDPLDRLHGANEHALADAIPGARHIQHHRGPIGDIDIGMPPPQEQRAVPGRHAAEGMAGGVALQIGLGLDDPAGAGADGRLAHDHLAKQIAGKRDSAGRKFGMGETAQLRFGQDESPLNAAGRREQIAGGKGKQDRVRL